MIASRYRLVPEVFAAMEAAVQLTLWRRCLVKTPLLAFNCFLSRFYFLDYLTRMLCMYRLFGREEVCVGLFSGRERL